MNNDTQYAELYNILVEKIHNPAINWKDISDVRERYGIKENLNTLRKGSKLFYEFINAGWTMTPPVDSSKVTVPTRETVTINADKSETSERTIDIEDDTQLKDSRYLLIAHGYDPDLFELTKARNSKWDNGVKTLYASKITVRPRTPDAIDPESINELFSRIKPVGRKTMPYPKCSDTADKLLVISLSDLHLNLKASMKITNNEYDCLTAQVLAEKVVDDILKNINTDEIERIIFTVGGDMLNADNQNNTTTKGTPQDCEKHLFEAFEDVLGVVYSIMYDLLTVAPVDVIYIPGNHDETVGWFLAKVLEAAFSDIEKVTVDTSPLPRKYYVYGNTLLVFAHTADEKKLPAIVADEAREHWSGIKYTDVFLQHLHSEQVLVEDHHMRIQRLPTISGMSKWTNDNGFKSRRMNKAFVYDKTSGLRQVLYTPID